MSDRSVHVIGAGLAGCEAAWQAANMGVKVVLHEMKPNKMTPAHHQPLFGELVCSNSLRSEMPENAVGLLKAEKVIGVDPITFFCYLNLKFYKTCKTHKTYKTHKAYKTYKPYKLSIKPRSFLFPCGPQQRSRHNRRASHTL